MYYFRREIVKPKQTNGQKKKDAFGEIITFVISERQGATSEFPSFLAKWRQLHHKECYMFYVICGRGFKIVPITYFMMTDRAVFGTLSDDDAR